MMRSLLLSFFIVPGLALSQYTSMLRSGSMWYESVYESGTSDLCLPGSLEYGRVYFVGGDSIINGETYKKMMYHPLFETDSIIPSTPCNFYDYSTDYLLLGGLLREDETTQRVYRWDEGSDTAYCIYDFLLDVGDTLFQPGFSDFIVESVELIEINGTLRKKISNDGGISFIEGVGCEYGPMIPMEIFISGYFSDVCLRYNDINEYGQCIQYLETEEASIEPIISLFPNPATSTVQINRASSDSQLFQIHSATGSLVLSTVLKDQQSIISLNGIEPGIYFCTIDFFTTLRLVVE